MTEHEAPSGRAKPAAEAASKDLFEADRNACQKAQRRLRGAEGFTVHICPDCGFVEGERAQAGCCPHCGRASDALVAWAVVNA